MRARQPNHPQTGIPLPLAVWHQLIDASVKGNYEKEDWEIAAEAIDEWVRRPNPDAIPMSADAVPYLQQASHAQVPPANARDEGRNRRQGTGITLVPPGGMDATDRSSNGDDRLAALLRHELLPLLYRLCAFDAMAPQSPTALPA